MCGDDKIAEVEPRYLRGQVVEVGRWDDAGLGAGARFNLPRVAAEVVKVKT